MRRHELSDQEWSRLEPLLPAERGRPGRPVRLPNRVFMNAIFYIAKTGAPWRDLPERFGPWKTVHTRFSRWNRAGVFEKILKEFNRDADNESNMADGSYAKAHQDSAGGKGGPKFSLLDALAEALPPSSTLVDGVGNPLHVHLSAGNIHDVTEAATLIEKAQGLNFIADTGYDANHVIEAIEKKKMIAVIPSTASRKIRRQIDEHLYKEHHLVENFFCKIKRYHMVERHAVGVAYALGRARADLVEDCSNRCHVLLGARL
jgi:transposase